MASKPIVAGTDGSEESLRAVDWAAREAALRGAPLRIVSAAALLPRMASRVDTSEQYADVTDVLLEDRDRALAAAAERAAKAAPGLLIDTDQLSGAPAQAVTDSGSGALMLVVGSRGRGAFTALVLGSVSRYVASHASCPVVVLREETSATRRQVGVGVADLDGCGDSLTFAFEEASLRQASLMAIYAWHTPQADISRAGESFTPAGRTPSKRRWRGSLRHCSTAGGTSTPTYRSARTSCTVTLAGRWSACPPALTWWSSAGVPSIPSGQAPARSGTPS